MLHNPCRAVALRFSVFFIPAMCALAQDHIVPTDVRGRPLYQAGSVAVKFKPAVSVRSRAGDPLQTAIPSLNDLLTRFSVTSTERMFRTSRPSAGPDIPELSRIHRVVFPEHLDVLEVARAFASDPSVEYAEPVPANYLDDVPNDSLYAWLHHLPRIMAEQAWDVHKGENGDSSVIVAIIDSGIEWFHPDLAPNIWQNMGEDADGDGRTIEFNGTTWVMDPGDLNGIDNDGNGYVDDLFGWDVANNDNNPNTGDSHGTHVAGITAGATNNRTGIASIGWNVWLMPVSSWNGSFLPNPYDGIIYAAENGAHVINNSWGGGAYARAYEEVIAYAHALGSIVVASAGNDNNDLAHFPSGYQHVLSVAATDVNDRKSPYSTYGISVDVSGPGGSLSSIADRGILSTGPNGSYFRTQGTSMSSPLVAGTLALIKSARPTWSNDRIVGQLLATADDISGLNTVPLGSGRVNAFRALTETTATVRQELRLELAGGLNYFNMPYARTLIPGDTALLHFTIRNYAHFVSSENATFTLSTTDTSLQILNPVTTDSIAADGYSVLEHVFRVVVSPAATPHNSRLTLSVVADKPITHGSTLHVDVFVSGAGVFVWEALPERRDFSGSFIADLFASKGVPVVYSNSYPTTLEGFSAAFFSYGNYGSFLRLFDDSMVVVVRSFLERGGRVYLEGSGSLTADQRNNSELLSLFGISSVNAGTSTKSPITNLSGQPGALTGGMMFTASNQISYSFIGRFTPSAGGVAALVEPSYGTVGVQHTGTFGQRTFASTYPLAELVDRDTLSNRYGLFIKIAQFFGLPVGPDYLVADFTSIAPTGHSPLSVPFTDRTASNGPVTSWEWDFNGDGVIDATDRNPSFQYMSPGTYQVTLRSGNGSTFSDRTRTEYVHVFDGNSALLYDRLESFVDVPASASLNVTNALTVEAWIFPLGWGEAGSGFGRIVDKSAVLIFLETGGILVTSLDHSNGAESRTNTPPGSITLNNWQHVAVTYSGASSELKMYVNGIPQLLNMPDPITGPLLDHRTTKLVIGNNSARTRTFDGKIDELRIWDIERSEADLRRAMDDTLNGDEPGLVAYWRFDEGTGSLARDRSPNGNNGVAAYTAWRQGWLSPVTSLAGEGSETPARFELQQNYPNPFNPTTDIVFGTARHGEVKLAVFDLLGREVAVLVNDIRAPGTYRARFDSRGLASGVYLYRLQAGGAVQTRKMMLVR